MNKAELIDALIIKHHQKREMNVIQKADMTAVVDGLTEIVQEHLAHGQEVTLPGIGKFSVTERAARSGRNPQTGEELEIPASKAPKFKASKALKEAVNHE
ncbi:HU family DNA-binding protein [Marinobacter sp. MCTG268]|uniref:HU family DNA-binding protein n=1 Tax=Marinobacter adhaerens TaxID=1033846 RepID=UPI00055D5015